MAADMGSAACSPETELNMKFNINKLLLGAGMALACTAADAQLLEDIIVETYYISDADDATDSDGGSLPVGSTTYRIFVDMAPGAALETIFGDGNHTLFINSTTGFFNNEDRGATNAEGVGTNRLGDNTVAVDSWLSFGGASSTKLGVLKSADPDGSIVGGANNDGGSAAIATGLLKNADPNAGIPLTTSDGLITGTPAATGTIGLDVTMFDDVNSTTNFSTTNGAWFTLGGTQGVDPNATNRLLVAQITVLGGGQLSFELNMRLNDGQGNTVDYVANNPQAGEVAFAALTYPQALDCEGTPGGSALPGTMCDDGDANTGNDMWDANCNCVGQLIDCEGVAGGSALPGTMCDDGNASTGNDMWDAQCNCVGQLIDCEGVAGGSALPGTMCDDGDVSTGNDMYDANCNCVGELIDCEGVAGGSALPGTLCDDGDANTTNDLWDAQCNCAGTPLTVDCEGIPGGSALPGTMCDDGDATTGNDLWDANCTCVGQLIDCEGVAGGTALPGTMCDDGDANTTNDLWDAQCNCAGTPLTVDCEGTPGGSALPGTMCDDGDATTGNDMWDANCTCVGQLIDCEGVAGGTALPGTMCDDGDANTTNDLWDAQCNCAGTPLTTDCEGTPGGSALPGTPCDDGDPNTTGDTWDANCTCAGTSNLDCEGIPGGNALPGTPCDDGDLNTSGETWDANCNCTGGQLVDCEGTPGGSVLPGSPCDDNNPFTSNDAYDANCTCVGVLPTACDGQPGGLEGILVETYYIADPNDAADTDGAGNLIQGATTYRIYVDMAPGYTLETVFGDANHMLDMQTSTFFYNQEDRGEATGDVIDATRLDENTLAIDSWLTFGAASDSHWGIPKLNDPDGSIVGGANNDGGSNMVPGGLLVNDDPNAGLELTVADGLIPAAAPSVGTIGFPNLDAFLTNTESSFSSNNGAWFVLGGVQGQNPGGDNRVLVAQVTTNGDFSFELNLRLGVPGGGTEDWVASNPLAGERTCGELTYLNVACPPFGTACDDGDPNTTGDIEDGFCNCVGQMIDCEGTPGGSALPGTACDDLDPNTVNDTWDANCNCVGTPAGSEQVTLEITLDDLGSETTWAVYDATGTNIIASGGPYSDGMGGTVITEQFFLPQTCYELVVSDAGNNGIMDGGYVLYDGQGERIIVADGLFGATSQIANGNDFCLPLSGQGLIAAWCDKTDLPFNGTSKLYASTQPGATMYQFWIYDPHGSYSRKVATSSTIVTPTYLVTNPVPADIDLNVRVRVMQGGVYGEFGRACVVRLNSAPPSLAGREQLFDVATGTVLTMWPNPNRDEVLYLKLEGLETGMQDITIDIHDMFGKRVFGQELDNFGEVFNHAIDLGTDIAPGMYLVNIRVNDQLYTQRLVRQ